MNWGRIAVEVNTSAVIVVNRRRKKLWPIGVLAGKKGNCWQQIAFRPTQHVSICINFDTKADMQFVHYSIKIECNNKFATKGLT